MNHAPNPTNPGRNRRLGRSGGRTRSMSKSTAANPRADHDGWWTRAHALTLVVVVVTAVLLVLCWSLVQPFVNPIAWALALAVVAHPLHGWIARRIGKPGL